jgi:colicin import membrane protein
VHAGLVAALSVSIDWRSRQPEVVAAELWAAVPQTAAPAPLPPPVPSEPAPPAPPVPAPPAAPVAKPAPQPDPDIALERERRLKAEKLKADDELQKAEAERKKKAEEKKAELKKEAERKRQEAAEAARVAEEKAEDERLNKQRQENMRRMLAQAGTASSTGSTGNAAQSAPPSANYLSRLRKLVRDQVVFNGSVPGNAAAEVAVTTAPGGTIISSRLTKSSGHKEWDDAVIRALEKLGSLPRDTDGRVPPSLTLVFRQTD